MASRAIIRRKKCLLAQLNGCKYSNSGFSSLWHGRWVSEMSSSDTGCQKEQNLDFAIKKGLSRFSTIMYCEQHFSKISVADWGCGRTAIVLPSGTRWISQAIRHASTVAARKDEMNGGDEHKDDRDQKRRKDASPEDCDHAIEGLSTAKAKAKAKKSSKKTSQSINQKLLATFSGIGASLRAVVSTSREDWALKIKHWNNKLRSGLQHYWLGLRLLWADVRISSRLLLKLADGKSLSRRARRQLTRTTADIFRLVPFAVFVIVPFMEFLLPAFLKLFPNMLPSTFKDKMKEQDTVKEMAKKVQKSHGGDIKQTAEDLDKFLNKVRTGASVSNDEILSFAKLFSDELTLENISRPSLVNMCRYMGIRPFGTDDYLRFMLRKKLEWIKKDDRLIQLEGIESLSEYELRQACRERGHLGLLSTEEMRRQLQDWLDLSLNHEVPSSLLILSRAFTVSGKMRPEEAIGAALSTFPDELVNTVETDLPSKDVVSEMRRKLEFLKMQELLIKEEEGEQEMEKRAKVEESEIREDNADSKGLTTARKAEELAREKAIEKQEELCKISRALAVLASASSVSRERQEFLSLVNKEIELYNTMLEKEGSTTTREEGIKEAYKAARKKSDHLAEDTIGDEASSALTSKVDAMLQELEKEIDDVDAIIGSHCQILDSDHGGKVTPEELAAAAVYLKGTLDNAGIEELISNLSKDEEGKILVEDIVKLGAQTDDTDSDEAECSSRQ